MSKKKLEVALIGAGRMAQVVGHLLLGAGHHVRLWTRSPASHPKLREMLPGLELAPDLETAITPADVLFLAIPTDALIEVCTAAGAYTRGYQVVLHASRGIADGFLLPHQAIRSVTGLRKIGALGGPLHSRDLGSGRDRARLSLRRGLRDHPRARARQPGHAAHQLRHYRGRSGGRDLERERHRHRNGRGPRAGRHRARITLGARALGGRAPGPSPGRRSRDLRRSGGGG